MYISKKLISLALAFIGLGLVATSCIYEYPDPEACRNIQEGSRIPNFTIQMNDGSSLSNEQLKGNASVIFFFDACNTYECDKQLKQLQMVYDQYKDAEDVRFVMMSRDNSEEEVEACWKRNKLTMPYSVQTDHYVYYLFSEYGIPKLYLTCYQNIVWHFHNGTLASAEQIVKEIEDCKTKCDK